MVEITIRKRPRTDAVVTQRKFFKKTARGKVIKGRHDKLLRYNHSTQLTYSIVLRERYLRDDVSCGIQDCSLCDPSFGPTLPSNGAFEHSLFSNGHFVIPDTNVFLSQVSLISTYSRETGLHFPDGPYGVFRVQSTCYPSADRDGRSQTPLTASIQPPEGLGESG